MPGFEAKVSQIELQQAVERYATVFIERTAQELEVLAMSPEPALADAVLGPAHAALVAAARAARRARGGCGRHGSKSLPHRLQPRHRIAFNPDGDTFEDPTSKDDKTGAHPFVLLDGIADEAAAKQTVKVTLPNVTCERCTLQLIQVMYDKGGNGFGGNDGIAPDNDDLYYACADIVLKSEPITGNLDGGVVGNDAGQGRPDAGDSGAAVVRRDAATPDPDPVRDAGKRKDASAAADDAEEEDDGEDTS